MVRRAAVPAFAAAAVAATLLAAAASVVAAHATAAADESVPSAGAVIHLHAEERPDRTDADVWAPDDDPAAASDPEYRWLLDATHAAQRSRWRATVTAVRVLARASGATQFVRTDRPLANADDLAAIRASVAAGDASVEHRVEASGPCGATRHASDGATTSVRLHDDDESSVGGAADWGVAAAAEAGLDVRIETAPSGDGRWRTHVVVVWSDAPERTRAPWLDDEDVDRIRVGVFAADVTLDLRGGETAAIRGTDASGAARLVLVRLDGDAPDAPLVRDVDGVGLVVPIDLVDDPGEPSAWPVDDGPPARADADEERAAIKGPFEWRSGRDGAWSPNSYGVLGVFRTTYRTDGAEEELRAALSVRRGAGAVEIARPAGPRVVLPAAPGTLFRAFCGTVETERRGVQSNPACDDCLVLRTDVGVEAFGLGASGGAWPDGTIDLDLVERSLVTETVRDFVGRRALPGHRTTAPFPLRVPLRRVRETSVGGCVGPAAPRIGRAYTARFVVPEAARSRPDPWARAAPVDVRVGDDPLSAARLPLRPGRKGRVVERTRTGFVTEWESDGWCGMRARVPVVAAIDEGIDVRLELDADGREVGVVAELRGAPEIGARVDPRDGEVAVVRSPFLRYAAAGVVPPADGRVAWSGPLALVLGLPPGTPSPDTAPDASPRPAAALGLGPREDRRPRAGCAAPAASRTVFAYGGETTLPTEQECYSSNHETGEVVSGFGVVTDGVEATLGATDEDDGARDLAIEFRTPPAWTQHVLRKSTVPPRDGETETGLVYVRRAVRRAAFSVVPARGFRRASAGPRDLPEIVVAAVAPAPAPPTEGDRR